MRVWWWAAGAFALIAAHVASVAMPDNRPNPLALADHLFALGLAVGLLLLGTALGARLLRQIGLADVLDLEQLLFASGVGLGALAYVVLACGFLGLLHPWALLVALAALTLLLWRELGQVTAAASAQLSAWLAWRREVKQPVPRITLVLVDLLLVALLLLALTPPLGYDGLMYHLTGPREFLRLGRLAPLPELEQANMPFTVDMLYLVAVAFESSETANLLHLASALLLALATFSFGRRFFTSHTGLAAALIFLSAPALFIYAPQANIDYGWAFFDFLAVYAFAVWTRERRPAWLVVAGIAAGLSLGSKYLGLLTFGALGLSLVLVSLRSGRTGFGPLVQSVLAYGLTAALVAAPWYLKNWLWLGSPVWPFLASNRGEGAYVVAQMGRGRELLDLLTLPLQVYQGDFVEYSAARPAFLFLLVPAYVLLRKHPVVTLLLALSALHYLVWTQGVQAIRYLFPIFPALSLAAAYTLERLRSSMGTSSVGSALLGLSMLVAVSSAGLVVLSQQTFRQLIGIESRRDFLARMLREYEAFEFLNDRSGDVRRVLVLNEGRIYYIEPPLLLDQGWQVTRQLAEAPDPSAATAVLADHGISHVLVGSNRLEWIDRFDPEHRFLGWWQGFERLRPAYLEPVFSNQAAIVYRIRDAAVERSQP